MVYNGGEIMSPTALTLTPDQAMLLVGDGMDRYQWSFQIAADGSLVNGEPFQRLEMPEEGLFSGVGGLTVDTLGYMWATSAMGIQVCEQPGRCTNILNKPEFNGDADHQHRVRRTRPRLAVRHARRQALPQETETHRRGGVGTGQAAAARSMSQNSSVRRAFADSIAQARCWRR